MENLGTRRRFWTTGVKKGENPSNPIEILLSSWGPGGLLHAHYRSVFELLLRRGAAKGHTANLLIQFTIPHRHSRPWFSTNRIGLFQGNQLFTQLLIEDIARDDISEVLAQYIVAWGGTQSRTPVSYDFSKNWSLQVET